MKIMNFSGLSAIRPITRETVIPPARDIISLTAVKPPRLSSGTDSIYIASFEGRTALFII